MRGSRILLSRALFDVRNALIVVTSAPIVLADALIVVTDALFFWTDALIVVSGRQAMVRTGVTIAWCARTGHFSDGMVVTRRVIDPIVDLIDVIDGRTNILSGRCQVYLG